MAPIGLYTVIPSGDIARKYFLTRAEGAEICRGSKNTGGLMLENNKY
jgi:hypothetical protein